MVLLSLDTRLLLFTPVSSHRHLHQEENKIKLNEMEIVIEYLWILDCWSVKMVKLGCHLGLWAL